MSGFKYNLFLKIVYIVKNKKLSSDPPFKQKSNLIVNQTFMEHLLDILKIIIQIKIINIF